MIEEIEYDDVVQCDLVDTPLAISTCSSHGREAHISINLSLAIVTALKTRKRRHSSFMIVMFMVLVVFIPSTLVEGEGVDEGPLVALAVPTEPASSQRSTDQKNEADRLSENSHLGLQVVGHEHC